MTIVIAPDLIRTPEEEGYFNYQHGRCGAGNAVSKGEMLAVMPGLGDFDFRVTDTHDGFVSIWVNKAQYVAYLASQKQATDKKDLKEALRFLPHLSLVLLVASVAISAVVAWKVTVLAFLFPGLAAVGIGTAFGYALVVCLVVSALIIVAYILNRGS